MNIEFAAGDTSSDQFLSAAERARAVRTQRMADASMPLAGGTAFRSTKGSWLNVALGLGLGGDVPSGAGSALGEWYDQIGRASKAEVCDRAPAALFEELSRAGYRLREIVAVLRKNLGDAPRVPAVPGVEIVRLDHADGARCGSVARVLCEAFAPEGAPAEEESVALSAATLRHSDTIAFCALSEGRPVGAGMMDVRDGVAALWGAAVAPEFRRRGVQRALMAVRLAEAVRAGAHAATVETSPGGPTHRNAARWGFALAYSRAVLTRPAGA